VNEKAILVKDENVDKWMSDNVFENSSDEKYEWDGQTIYETEETEKTHERIKKKYCSQSWECFDYRKEPVLKDFDKKQENNTGDGIWRVKVKKWMYD
jgi:hypothetical protein